MDDDAVGLAGGGEGGAVPFEGLDQRDQPVAGGGREVVGAGAWSGSVAHDREAMAELIGFSTRGRM